MKPALGKGLGALLPKTGPESPELEIERIIASADQPRKHFREESIRELSASIKEKGILQPLIVSPNGDGSFMLIAGERRLRAARLAGLRKVPVTIKKLPAQDSLEVALIENIQREDLNPVETANAIERLKEDFRLTQEELSLRLGMDRATIANYLRLLKLPAEVKTLVAHGKLSMGHAKVLLGFESQSQQVEVAARAAGERLSVRQLEGLLKKALIGGANKDALRKTALQAKDPNIADLEDRLTKALGTKVRLRPRGRKTGTLEIEYYNLDQLQGIIERMM
ncbi:MAG: ParB/RepB/Spo0J family partition protein [Nitrospiraceae bacterium]|nr:ParB/RepB/Spo0J family partition protein [Nitrospiraceae bacterium]